MQAVQAFLCSLPRFIGPAGSDNVVTPCWEQRYKAGMKKIKTRCQDRKCFWNFPFFSTLYVLLQNTEAMFARYLHMLSTENCEWFLVLVRLWPGSNLQ